MTPPQIPAPNALIVTYTTTAAEQTRAAQAAFRGTPRWWIAHAVMVAVFSYGLYELLARSTYEHALFTMAFAVFGFVYFNFLIVRLAVAASRRGAQAPDGPFTWTFTPESARCSSPQMDTDLKWSAFSRAREVPDFFFLYTTAQRAHFVPKRALVGSQLDELRALLSRAGLLK
jgi:hypothetical protein